MIYAKDLMGGVGIFITTSDMPPEFNEITKDEYDKYEFNVMKIGGGAGAKALGKQIFIKEMKATFADPLKFNGFLATYPLFMHAYETEQWADMQPILTDAKAKNIVDDAQLLKFKELIDKYIVK